jgi:hypothetical protein
MLGGDQPVVTEVIAGESFTRFLPAPDAQPFYIGAKGKYLIVGLGEDSVTRLFKNAQTAAPDWLTDAVSSVAIKRPAVFAHANVEKFLADNATTFPKELTDNLVTSGLASAKSVSFCSGFGETRYESKLLIDTDGKLEGVFSLFDVTPLTEADLSTVPSDTGFFQAMNVDLTKGESTLVKLVALNMGVTEVEAKEKINAEMEAYGLNISDTLALVKGTYLETQPDSLGLVGLDSCISLDSPNSQRLADIASSFIASTITPFGGANSPNPGDEEDFGFMFPQPELIEKRFRENDYRIYKLGGFMSMPFTPSWGVVNGRFTYSNTPQGIRTAARSGKPEKSVATDPVIAAALKQEPLYMYRRNWKSAMPLILMGGQTLVNYAEFADIELPEGLDPTLMPSPRIYQKYSEPTVGMLTKHEKGLHFHLEESYPTLFSPSSVPVAVAVGVSYLRTAREAALRNKSMNNLRQVALAALNYESATVAFPADIVSEDGKPLLSWRVQILPYMEETELYEQFKLDEPWDSEHNIKLIEKMPEVLQSPGFPNEEGKTHYLAIKTDNSVIITPEKGKKGIKIGHIKDGTSKTVLAAECKQAEIWTKPADFSPKPDDPGKGLFGLRPDSALVVFADSHVQAIHSSADKGALNAVFTRNGGEPIDTWSLDGPDRGYPAEAAATDDDAIYADDVFDEFEKVEELEDAGEFPEGLPDIEGELERSDSALPSVTP